jgi:hypothetical protein
MAHDSIARLGSERRTRPTATPTATAEATSMLRAARQDPHAPAVPRPARETAGTSAGAPHSSSLTVVSIAVVACAAADMVHEGLGHGVASWLAGDTILSISTVAMQNAEPNRLVAACGTSANLVVGCLSLVFLRRIATFTPWACFLLLFGAFNMFNCGYLAFSALSGSGDWAVVIAGLEPPFLWRTILAVAGVALYVLAIRWTAGALLRYVDSGDVALPDVRRLTLAAYLAGGALMTAASVLNPIGPSLILTSGVAASFGLNFGMLLVPGIVAGRARNRTGRGRPLAFSTLWLSLALVVAAAFIAVLGPGIRFPQQH